MVRRSFMVVLTLFAMFICFKVSATLADTPTKEVVSLQSAKPPFDPAVDGFSFANYPNMPEYINLTSVEVRRMFGDKACAAPAKSDGSCTLTPPAEKWLAWANSTMRDGHCEGLAAVSLLMYNGVLKPQDFGAARTIDLTLEGNSKLQREIAYWYVLVSPARAATIKSSPNAVVAALRNNLFGTLRFSKLDRSGGHAVVPITLTNLANNQVSIAVYDVNYPKTTHEILIDTVANTWFYSPDSTLTEDDYQGDASSQTLGFAPTEARLMVQDCPFCAPSSGSRNFSAPTLMGSRPEGKQERGEGGTVKPTYGDTPIVSNEDMPSSNQTTLKSWQIPAHPYYTFVPTDTVIFELTAMPQQTQTITTAVTYLGPGYVFEVGNVLPQQGHADLIEIAPGGETITYTTGTGEIPELFIGFETTAADFGFSLYDFEMAAGDAVVLTIDTAKKLLDVRIVTASPTDDIVFSLAMERLDATSSDVFQSPDEGLTLANGQTLLIDYSQWDGNDKPLDLGYDDNKNGSLESSELFEVEDAGDSLDGSIPATPTHHTYLPLIMRPALPAFDPAVNGFSFSNYNGAANYAKLTSVEVRRLFGDKVCATAVKSDGTCTLTPQGERWLMTTNDYMREGHCEGLAVASLLMYNGLLKPQDFGAARAIDLTIANNPKLQREIAYWFATTFVDRSNTIKNSPNDVVAALRQSMFGTLRFSKPDGSGGHAVVPISMTTVANNQVSIKIYDSNYPQATREILVDTAANTWFYSPDSTLTADDYRGTATSKTLGFAPIAPRLTQQPCPFCGYYPQSARQISTDPSTPVIPIPFPDTSISGTLTLTFSNTLFKGDVKMILPIDSSYLSYQGALGTKGNESHKFHKTPVDINVAFPSSNGEQLKSWEVPARPFFTFVPTATAELVLVASPAQTTPFTTSLVYNGPGYFFEVGNLLLEPGQLDLFEVAPGGTAITYTTSITGTGGDHEFLLGFETAAADFDFYLHDFEMEAGDAVVLTIDAAHLLVEVKIVTTSPTDDVIFSFAMERIGDGSTEIFESPDEGMTLANGQTLLIDYSEWDGNGKPLHLGYDDNHNSMLEAAEKFDIVDSGDTFEE